jgi:hypothetical protein
MNRGRDRAFPLENPRNTRQLGMTIREYAAVHIAAGVAANPELAFHGEAAMRDAALAITGAVLAALDEQEEDDA